MSNEAQTIGVCLPRKPKTLKCQLKTPYVYINENAPYIGENGNWYVFSYENLEYIDSGVSASGGSGGESSNTYDKITIDAKLGKKIDTYVGEGEPSSTLSMYNDFKEPSLYFDSTAKNMYSLFLAGSTVAKRRIIASHEVYSRTESDEIYVPTVRKVANKALSEDVTPLQIIASILDDSDAQNRFIGGVDYTVGSKTNLTTINKTNIVKAINEINEIAKKANNAVSFGSYSELVNQLNSADAALFEVGQSIYIRTLNVPDLWVYYVTTEDIRIEYQYTTDAALIEEINTVGFVQIGCYYIAQLETQKVNLSEYDTSEVVDAKIATAIEEALNNMPTAEGSEF